MIESIVTFVLGFVSGFTSSWFVSAHFYKKQSYERKAEQCKRFKIFIYWIRFHRDLPMMPTLRVMNYGIYPISFKTIGFDVSEISQIVPVDANGNPIQIPGLSFVNHTHGFKKLDLENQPRCHSIQWTALSTQESMICVLPLLNENLTFQYFVDHGCDILIEMANGSCYKLDNSTIVDMLEMKEFEWTFDSTIPIITPNP